MEQKCTLRIYSCDNDKIFTFAMPYSSLPAGSVESFFTVIKNIITGKNSFLSAG